MANPVASIEIQAKSAGLSAQLREARAQFGQFADGVAQIFIDKAGKRAKKGGLGGFGKSLAVAGGNLLSAGIGRVENYVEDVGKQTIEFEEGLTRFQIAARQTPAQIDALRASIGKLSIETGLGKEEILGGARAFVDLAGAGAYSEGVMKTIARAAQASGADVKDVATTVYSLGDAMHIDPSEMEATLGGLINQSKDGAVHFNQLAAEIVGIAPRFARFGVLGREGTVQFGAMFQVMRSGFKDSAETATGLSGMFRGIITHADRFAKAGVNVYNVGKDGTKTLKPVLEILEAIGKSKLAKDPTMLQKAFGRGEGEQAFQMWSKHLDLFNQLVDAGRQNNTVQQDLAAFTQSTAGRLDIAMNKLKQSIADAFTPERIQAFADLLERIVGYAAKVAAFTDHMLGGDEGVRGTVANKLVEQANNDDDEKRMVQLAKDAIQDPTGNAAQHLARVAVGLNEAQSPSAAQTRAAVEGAKDFLKSEGVDVSSWGATRKGQGANAYTAAAQQAAFAASLTPQAIAAALAKALTSVPIVVQMDGKTIVTTAKESPVHRHGVKR